MKQQTQQYRELERVFASRAQTRVVQYFLNHPKEILLPSTIARGTGLAHSTVIRVMQPLVKIRIVIKNVLSEQVTIFYLNSEDRKTKILADFYTKIRPFLKRKNGVRI